MNGDNPYLDFITSEHRKPNYLAVIDALTRGHLDNINLLNNLYTYFDLETAVGAQLDAVGRWIGVSRILQVPLPDVYFSFDIEGLGFDQGTWWFSGASQFELSLLADDAYRILLKAKIRANNWDGTEPLAVSTWNLLFAQQLGLLVSLKDNQDMTQTITFSGPPPNAVVQGLVNSGALDLKPVTVTSSYTFITPVSMNFVMNSVSATARALAFAAGVGTALRIIAVTAAGRVLSFSAFGGAGLTLIGVTATGHVVAMTPLAGSSAARALTAVSAVAGIGSITPQTANPGSVPLAVNGRGWFQNLLWTFGTNTGKTIKALPDVITNGGSVMPWAYNGLEVQTYNNTDLTTANHNFQPHPDYCDLLAIWNGGAVASGVGNGNITSLGIRVDAPFTSAPGYYELEAHIPNVGGARSLYRTQGHTPGGTLGGGGGTAPPPSGRVPAAVAGETTWSKQVEWNFGTNAGNNVTQLTDFLNSGWTSTAADIPGVATPIGISSNSDPHFQMFPDHAEMLAIYTGGTPSDNNGSITSPAFQSQTSAFGYSSAVGYYEGTFQIPNVVGMWPAWWCIGWNPSSGGFATWGPEIDCFEFYGQSDKGPTKPEFTLHSSSGVSDSFCFMAAGTTSDATAPGHAELQSNVVFFTYNSPNGFPGSQGTHQYLQSTIDYSVGWHKFGWKIDSNFNIEWWIDDVHLSTRFANQFCQDDGTPVVVRPAIDFQYEFAPGVGGNPGSLPGQFGGVNVSDSTNLARFKVQNIQFWGPGGGAVTPPSGVLDDEYADVFDFQGTVVTSWLSELFGAVPSNAVTWDPANSSQVTLSGSNLVATIANSWTDGDAVRTSVAMTPGTKIYFEITMGTVTDQGWCFLGFGNANWPYTSMLSMGVEPNSIAYRAGGYVYVANNAMNHFGGGLWDVATTGDVVCFAVDLVSNQFWMRVNGGTWQGMTAAPDPATAVGGFNMTPVPGPYFFGFQNVDSGNSVTANFGASTFAQAVPAGFAAWGGSGAGTNLSFLTAGGNPPGTSNITGDVITAPAGTMGTSTYTRSPGIDYSAGFHRYGCLIDTNFNISFWIDDLKVATFAATRFSNSTGSPSAIEALMFLALGIGASGSAAVASVNTADFGGANNTAISNKFRLGLRTLQFWSPNPTSPVIPPPGATPLAVSGKSWTQRANWNFGTTSGNVKSLSDFWAAGWLQHDTNVMSGTLANGFGAETYGVDLSPNFVMNTDHVDIYAIYQGGTINNSQTSGNGAVLSFAASYNVDTAGVLTSPGYYEATFNCSFVTGYWPAWWMIGHQVGQPYYEADWGPEIDMFELNPLYGVDSPTSWASNFHAANNASNKCFGNNPTGPNAPPGTSLIPQAVWETIGVGSYNLGDFRTTGLIDFTSGYHRIGCLIDTNHNISLWIDDVKIGNVGATQYCGDTGIAVVPKLAIDLAVGWQGGTPTASDFGGIGYTGPNNKYRMSFKNIQIWSP
jgi:hypothetical protein